MNKQRLAAISITVENDQFEIAARGDSEIAAELRRTARRFGIPVITDRELAARLLSHPEDTPLEAELQCEIQQKLKLKPR